MSIEVETVIFDLDGTIVDTAPDLHAATNVVLAHFQRQPIRLGQIRDLVGYGARALIEKGLEITGGQQGLNMDEAHSLFLSHYQDHIAAHSKVYEGAEQLLTNLHESGARVGLCTNKPRYLALDLLEQLGLSTYFHAVHGGDNLPYRKPDPRHIISTIEDAGGSHMAVMIGDSTPDVQAAKGVTIPSIVVRHGYSSIPVDQIGADYVVDDLPAVSRLLRPTPPKL